MVNVIRGDELFNYDVLDANGDKIGDVDAVWLDEESGRPEFIGVKTGFLSNNHVAPLGAARFDGANNTILLPFTEDQIKDAPTFDADENLSDENERDVYDFYGLTRGDIGAMGGTATTGTMDREKNVPGFAGTRGERTGTPPPRNVEGEETDNVTMTEAEEDVNVTKRTVPAGGVRLRKVVRTENKEIPVELTREEIHLERVPAEEIDESAANAFHNKDVVLRAKREEPVIEKERRVTGGVRAYKTEDTERGTVEGQVRQSDVDVERTGPGDTNNLRRD